MREFPPREPQGVAIPKQYFGKVHGALINQDAHLKSHPEALKYLKRPTSKLRAELRRQLASSSDYELTDKASLDASFDHETDAIIKGPDSHVEVTGDDPIHVASGLRRIGDSLAFSAIHHARGPLYVQLARQQAGVHRRLGDAILAYFTVSDEGRKVIPSNAHIEISGVANI